LGIGLIAFAILALGIWGLSSIPASPKSTQTPSPTQTLFVEPATKTPVPATSTATIVPTPTLGIGSTMIGKDGATLVYVPEGEFLMGSTDADTLASSDEKPQHPVTLDAYWIDQTEVTNKQYAACVSAGGCTPPSNTSSYTRTSYYGNSEFDEFPVISVDWNQASTYCLWAGRKLPSEAQWEKAARGTDAHTYPWGNDAPNDALLNYDQKIGDTTKVGSYETGKSIYGAYDMAGNVWEWVSSLFKPYPYDASDGRENMNSSTDKRVVRGGAWDNYGINARSAYRNWLFPTYSSYISGFRCARSP
jgi:serine/threonine-protein kinase